MMLLSLIFVGLIVFVWSVLFREVFLYDFRGTLFQIRHELFFLSVKNGPLFSFNSKLYTQFESSINGTIRYSHIITFYRSVIFFITLKVLRKKITHNPSLQRVFEEEKNSIQNEKVIQAVGQLIDRYHLAIGLHIVRSSFFISLCFLIYFIYYGFRSLVTLGFVSAQTGFQSFQKKILPSIHFQTSLAKRYGML